MTKGEEDYPGEETMTTSFSDKVDAIFERNKSSNIITIECGSWMSLCEYIMGDGPTAKQVTDFSDYAKGNARFKCLQTGGGVLKVEIRKDDA